MNKHEEKRILFNLTTCRAQTWDQTVLVRHLDDVFAKMLVDLPIVETTKQPTEEIFGDDPEQNYIVKYEGRTFYVDPNGSNFAYYAFEFYPQALEVK